MGVNVRAELGIKLGSQSLEGALVVSSSIYGMTGVRNKASWNAEPVCVIVCRDAIGPLVSFVQVLHSR